MTFKSLVKRIIHRASLLKWVDDEELNDVLYDFHDIFRLTPKFSKLILEERPSAVRDYLWYKVVEECSELQKEVLMWKLTKTEEMAYQTGKQRVPARVLSEVADVINTLSILIEDEELRIELTQHMFLKMRNRVRDI